MIILALGLIGALWGGLLARKRGGKPLDIAQYALVFAMALALLGLFITIFLERSL
ncbi:MAG: hypothetical protein OIF40_15975 [Mangrovicoccus sp.]|nr:hypothetical protein [Mangrovicoccus sp.]